MKIPYSNLPYKTNRNNIAQLGAGLQVPNNLENKMKTVKVTQLKMPKFVYHMSTSPISTFTPNRIFYVSFSKAQAFLHVSQYLNRLHKKQNNTNETKIYVYTLKPRKEIINAVIFDKEYRPKKISNTFGIMYNTYNAHKQMMKSFLGEKTTVVSQPFKEGSGNNMIFGHLICKYTGANGIRNTINQDELAVCNPKNFFSIYDKEVLNVGIRSQKSIITKSLFKKPVRKLIPYPKGQLPFAITKYLQNIKFMRTNQGMKYEPESHIQLLNRFGTSKIQNAKARLALRPLTSKK